VLILLCFRAALFPAFPSRDEKEDGRTFSEIESSSNKPAILIAVRDKEFATVLSYNLDLRHFNCLVMEDGKSAFPTFFDKRPEIVVLSFGIAKRDDGMEAAREIMRINSSAEVIVLTDSDPKVSNKSEQCGVELFIDEQTDPAKIEELVCAVSSLKKPACTLVNR
jgi:DNA-binding response OmpR family regulator